MRRIAAFGMAAVLAGMWAGAGGAEAGGGGASCAGLNPPTSGEMTADYDPGPGYGGHWGVDFAAEEGEPARAAADGTVSFSGVVAGNRTVTVEHGGGLKTSYSYLERARATRGQRVTRGQPLGQPGRDPHSDEEGPVLHFSVRIGGRYADPAPLLGCLLRSPAAGLRLVPVDVPGWR